MDLTHGNLFHVAGLGGGYHAAGQSLRTVRIVALVFSDGCWLSVGFRNLG